MRIITGQYKGRHFDIPRSFKARPTTDFAKENIFNVLTGYMDFEGATALDLFAGTGSISLELVSRGCQSVVSIEKDRDRHRFICDCLNRVGNTVCIPLRADVFRFIKSCRQTYDLVFADPPYALKELPTLPGLITGSRLQKEGGSGLLKEGGIFVLEHGKDHDFSAEPGFMEHRCYGSVHFSLFRPSTSP